MPIPVCSAPSLVALNNASLAHAASAYAEQGIPVFPVVPGDKMPRVARGFYRATTDASQIQRWWTAWPDANIGMATGTPSGLWVLDIDPRHGGLSSLEILACHAKEWGAALPLHATLCQLTGGGGLHLFYQMPSPPGTAPPNGPLLAYPGIEFKHTGSYVVAPPSRHPSGYVYQWQQDTGPAPFPGALLERWVHARSRASVAQEPQTRFRETRALHRDPEHDPAYWLRVSVRHAAPGFRHRYACFLAIQLVRVVGCSYAEAESWMRAYVSQVMHPPSDPYDLADALKCLRYAWGKYAS